MFCPECRRRYGRGVTTCPECGETLVPTLPLEETDEPLDLVTVLETSNAGKAMIARSLLDEAGIPYLPRGEQLQDLFGIGRLVPVNPITGPIVFQVHREDAEEARALLADLQNEADDEPEDDWDAKLDDALDELSEGLDDGLDDGQDDD